MEDRYWYEKHLGRTYATLDIQIYRSGEYEVPLHTHVERYEQKLAEAREEGNQGNIAHYEAYLSLLKGALGYREITVLEESHE